ncbi:MAG: hypothetical protein LC687_05705 [Actinobacteria bacterium]|nr:hypothetical protein [Actinomycetota bacterium]
MERSTNLPSNETIALYWEDDDWTCSFRCGVIAGHVYGWFGDPDASLEETQEAAMLFWDAPDTSTFSAYPGSEHQPPPNTRCRNPYCERLLR